jgi:pimeloyl-ACP methyl ester carboxylesterase
MRRIIYSYLRYMMWAIIVLLLYPVAYKVGKDARRTQRNQERISTITGPCQAQRLYRLHHRMLHDTIEENIRFSVRLAPDSCDRIERRGLLVRRPQSRAIILICHGFTCAKDDTRFLRGALFSEYTTLSFDFRAHGESCTSEHVCTFGSLEKYDVMGAVEFIRTQPDLAGKPIIVYGFSMGAVAAVLAQAERKDLFHAAILDCPFESTDQLIARLLNSVNFSVAGYEFGLPGKALLKRYAYNSYVQEIIKRALRIKTAVVDNSPTIKACMVPIDTVQAASMFDIPTLVIVCKKDDKAPVAAAYTIYNALPNTKHLWITNGREHFDSFFFNPEKYGYKIFQFIEEVLDKKAIKNRLEAIEIDAPGQDFWQEQCALYKKGCLS